MRREYNRMPSVDGKYILISSSGEEYYCLSNDNGTSFSHGAVSANWWDSAMSNNGQYQFLCAQGGSYPKYVSSNYGANFTMVGSSANRKGIACSIDARYIVSAVLNGPIEVSTDYGVTWNNRGVFGYHNGCAISDNGQYMIVGYDSGVGSVPSAFAISSDYGSTWTNVGNTTGRWFNIKMSANGESIYAASYSGGIYISNDYGNSWTLRSDSQTHYGISCSGTGQCVVAGDYSTTKAGLLVSQDYGYTFSTKSISNKFTGFSMSYSGQYMLATSYDGYLCVSTDFGSNWTFHGVSDKYQCSATSKSGKYMCAATSGGGGIYVSKTFGSSWSKIYTSSAAYNAIAMSKS